MKRFFFLVSFAALLYTGCGKDILPAADTVDSFVAEFAVEARTGVTKALADNDGSAACVDECLVQIWMKTGNTYKLYSKPEVYADGDNGHYRFSATFIRNQNYRILVWADKAGRYEFGDDATVTRVSGAVNNSDDLDAFYADVDIDASKAITDRTIIVKRPFAQINVITTDLTAIPAEYVPASIDIEYSAPLSMNLLSQELGADQTISIRNSPVYYRSTTGIATESTLSMDYIFAPEDREIKDFKFCIAYTEPVERNFTNIPIQRGYRTNIRGRLLAVGENFEVVIDPVWNSGGIDATL